MKQNRTEREREKRNEKRKLKKFYPLFPSTIQEQSQREKRRDGFCFVQNEDKEDEEKRHDHRDCRLLCIIYFVYEER